MLNAGSVHARRFRGNFASLKRDVPNHTRYLHELASASHLRSGGWRIGTNSPQEWRYRTHLPNMRAKLTTCSGTTPRKIRMGKSLMCNSISSMEPKEDNMKCTPNASATVYNIV